MPHFDGVEITTSSGRSVKRSHRALSAMNPRYRGNGGCVRPDDMTVDFTGEKLWTVSVGGGKPTPVAQGHISWPRWSPDGTRISYADAGYIYVLDVASRSTTKISLGGNAEWADDHTLIIGPGG